MFALGIRIPDLVRILNDWSLSDHHMVLILTGVQNPNFLSGIQMVSHHRWQFFIFVMAYHLNIGRVLQWILQEESHNRLTIYPNRYVRKLKCTVNMFPDYECLVCRSPLYIKNKRQFEIRVKKSETWG